MSRISLLIAGVAFVSGNVVSVHATESKRVKTEYESIQCDGTLVTLPVAVSPGVKIMGDHFETIVEKCNFPTPRTDSWEVTRTPDGVPFAAKMTYTDPRDMDPVEVKFEKQVEKPGFETAKLIERSKRQISCCLSRALSSHWQAETKNCEGLADLGSHRERLQQECYAQLTLLMKESRISGAIGPALKTISLGSNKNEPNLDSHVTCIQSRGHSKSLPASVAGKKTEPESNGGRAPSGVQDASCTER